MRAIASTSLPIGIPLFLMRHRARGHSADANFLVSALLISLTTPVEMPQSYLVRCSSPLRRCSLFAFGGVDRLPRFSFSRIKSASRLSSPSAYYCDSFFPFTCACGFLYDTQGFGRGEEDVFRLISFLNFSD